MLRYVHASIDCRAIFGGRLHGGRLHRGRVDGNVLLLLHLCENEVGAELVEDGKRVKLVLMI